MKILIVGIMGKMGQLLAHQIKLNPQFSLIGGIDTKDRQCADFAVYPSLSEAPLADVIIDFSYPDNIEAILSFAKEMKLPLVLATTGYTFEQEQLIIDASDQLPIFRSANFSYGILIMRKLLALATPYLSDFDIELVEAHHNKKADAPSGTAKLLIQSINDALPLSRDVNLGHGQGKRKRNSIGVHAIRAGSIAGDHSVLFASEAESIEISHRAFSKEVFAQGALRAAQFIISKSVGLYSMDDLL